MLTGCTLDVLTAHLMFFTCGWSSLMPVSKTPILTPCPLNPAAHSSGAPETEVTELAASSRRSSAASRPGADPLLSSWWRPKVDRVCSLRRAGAAGLGYAPLLMLGQAPHRGQRLHWLVARLHNAVLRGQGAVNVEFRASDTSQDQRLLERQRAARRPARPLPYPVAVVFPRLQAAARASACWA